MARLVFLAVLLAAATVTASADAAEGAKTLKLLSGCTDGTCSTCPGSGGAYTADGTCQPNGTNSYKATCDKPSAGHWTLELHDGTGCTTAAHAITSQGKCFTGQHITAKVTSIGEKDTSDKTYPVTVRVCDAADSAKVCSAVGNDEACHDKMIKVPTPNTACGRLGSDGLYYTATKAAGETDENTKPTKVTLKLYKTAETCKAEQLPVFEGVDMTLPPVDDTCKTYQQRLNAKSCGEKKVMNLKTCPSTSSECNSCEGEITAYIADGTCQGEGSSWYKATYKSDTDWSLELHDGTNCDNTAVHTITSQKKCFETAEADLFGVKVDSITEVSGENKYTVSVKVCKDKTCGCDAKTIEVAAGTKGTKCGRLDGTSSGLYYTATVKDGPKLNLKLYPTADLCGVEQLPLFEGEDMETTSACKTFQQKISAAAGASILEVQSCTDDGCQDATCTSPVWGFVASDKCRSLYKATCNPTAAGDWKLELHDDGSDCNTAAAAAHTITADKKCFAGQHITAKVTSIKDKTQNTDNTYPVTVRVCEAADKAIKCDAMSGCKEATIQVPTTATTCGRLGGDGLYYTAARATTETDGTKKPTKVTLKLYKTAETCREQQLPVFEGNDMAPYVDDTCKTYQQRLNAECSTPATTTNNSTSTEGDGSDSTTTTSATSTEGDGSNSNADDSNNTTIILGSAAVSAVLALLVAACAVWMM